MNPSKLRAFIQNYWILALLITIKFILQFTLVNPTYELHRDEFLHLDQAFHSSAGYISVPPFTSWIARIIYLFGGGLFWIRFFPALFGALTILIVWLIIEELGGRLPSKILASVFLIFSIITRINVLFQPNSFDILAWTIVFFLLIKYINTQQEKWFFLLSAIVALGWYNKYNIIFLITGLCAGLLLTGQRTIFTKKKLYIAMALCLALVLPNIIWQIENHFPLIYHLEALNKTQLVNVSRLDFLFDQIKFGLIGIVTLAALGALAFYKPFKSYRFILWAFLFIMALYTLCRAKSYYDIGLYPVLFAFGSVYLEAVLKKRKAVLIPLLAALNIFIFAGIAKFIMPYQSPSEISQNPDIFKKTGMLRWEDGKEHSLPQDFADMVGWQEMAQKTLTAYKMIPANELKNTLIFCDNYGQSGALNYYNRAQMPEAYSFNADYIYWLPHFNHIQNILLVGSQPNKEIISMFKSFKEVGIVENKYARERGTKIFLLLGANIAVTKTIYQIVEERKRKFDIF